jgi:aldehyde dehydrogenase (NAD+)
MTHSILQKLGLSTQEAGSYLGAGEWSKPGVGSFASHIPATGELLGEVSSATAAEYETIITRAQAAFLAWRQIPAPKRGEAIRLCGEALRKHKDALGSLVSLEMGKIKPEGDGEVQEMIDIADFAVGQARMLYGLTMHSERPGHRMYEQWHPLGLVGIISAFNFPVAVWAWNAFLAAICGNISIWKPSPKTPYCAIASQRICNEALKDAGFPEIFFMFNDGSNALAQKFVDDRRVALISFTGSSEIGKAVGQSVAARMGKSLLELGGNNCIIVSDQADLKLAVPAIVFGAVGTAGQRCTTTRRLIVHETMAEELCATLVKAYAQVEKRVGDPIEASTLLGPLVDEPSAKRFDTAVAAAKEQGGQLLCGGGRIARAGAYVQPTIFRMPAQTAIVRHETFVPILYVMTYKTLDEAIALQNDVPQGLSSSIFTLNMREAEQFLSAAGSDCGIANVNIGTSGAEIGGAFGGEKDTGGGRESGSTSWQAYMRRQTNTINYSTELPLAQGIKFDF